MKAAILNSNAGQFDLEEVTINSPEGREALVQVKACGLCHSDLHMAEANYGLPLPALLGHEIAGIVLAIGPDVRDLAVGDHVVGSLIQFCGQCISCLSGRSYQCEQPEATNRPAGHAPRIERDRDGKRVHPAWGTGGFAEQALIHENQLVKVPREIPFPQASLLGCGVITGAGAAINSAKVTPGETVAIIGIGGVGLNVISGAKLAGARQIIAIDAQPAKEEIARKFGATHFVHARQGDPVAAVLALSDGGVDHAFEVIGLQPTAEQAVRMVRRGGRAFLIGVPRPETLLSLSQLDVVIRQIAVQGVFMGSSNIKHDIPMYADLYLQGRFNLDDLISREINIAQINEAYDELKHGALARTVITSF